MESGSGVGFIQKHSFNSFVDLNPEHNYIPIVFSNEFNFQMFSPNNYVNFGFGLQHHVIQNSMKLEILWFDTFLILRLDILRQIIMLWV